MRITKIELLKVQAELLELNLQKLKLSLFDCEDFNFDFYYRIDRIQQTASLRVARRYQQHLDYLTLPSVRSSFRYYPDGFASSPALSSGVLGQGASL